MFLHFILMNSSYKDSLTTFHDKLVEQQSKFLLKQIINNELHKPQHPRHPTIGFLLGKNINYATVLKNDKTSEKCIHILHVTVLKN